jgi:hypothetical protein
MDRENADFFMFIGLFVYNTLMAYKHSYECDDCGILR